MKIEAYKELLKVVEKYSDVFETDHILPSKTALTHVLTYLEVSKDFDIPLRDIDNCYVGWLKVANDYNKFMNIGLFGEQLNRTISWSDDGTQPENEWLLKVGFPTGAYIFGDAYPQETFNAFFVELKSYQPKFCDTANHCLYFTKDNAKAVYENFYPILKKYQGMVADEVKEQRKQKLMKELEQLNKE